MARPVRTRNLTRRQQRFIEEYLVDLSATRAAIRAGYSPQTAEQISYQLPTTSETFSFACHSRRLPGPL